VVFDLDDTLYLERDYVLSSFRHIAKLVAADAGRSAAEIFAYLKESWVTPAHRGHNLDLLLEKYPGVERAWDARRLIEEYRTHPPTLSLLPGAASMLSELHNAGAHLAVITDGSPESQHAKEKALGLREYFELIVVTDDRGTQFRKPHPYAYERVSEEIECEPRSCVYVGDNPAKDFLAPRLLGWDTVRIRMANQLHAQAEPTANEAAARMECRSIPELRNLLLSRLT
jgi:putative hydrolase of the HAD superfamily